ncbi:AI-2E family transporter [Nocardioides bruguierae]|uniref:AI-2E family transporter n=1 Tax=Nocardioides bruguierae TaxID=2945102 RepID=UPI002020CD9A|nr:AI-2E family transporter [Nocardioides bruguierae]MCL8024313.1 AI-2E family transporter [Nocardioides bruguierae]
MPEQTPEHTPERTPERPSADPCADTVADGLPTYEAAIGQGIRWASSWTLRWLIIGLGVAATLWVVGLLWPAVFPILLGLIVATVLAPPARFLQQRLHFPSALAAATVLVVGLGALGGVVAAVLPSVVSQGSELGSSITGGLRQLQEVAVNAGIGIDQSDIDSAVDEMVSRVRSSSGSIATGVLTGVNAVTSGLVTGLLTLVLAFLFVKDGERFLPWLGGLLGPRTGPHVTEVLGRSWDTLGGFIRAQAVVGFLDAVFIAIGLVLLGVPLVLPLALLTFLAAFVPVVGAVAAGAVAVLVALVDQGPITALLVIGLVVLVQNVEGNLLSPWLQGRSLRLHAGVVLLSVTLGSSLFGVAGAFLAVPTAAVLGVLSRYLVEQARLAAGETVHTDAADGDDGPDDTAEDTQQVSPA